MKLGIYKHFKGNFYQVIGISRHSETLEEMVVYQALYGSYGLWVRPKSMFLELVSHDGTMVARFSFVYENYTKGPIVKL